MDLLVETIDRVGSPACIGIDPVTEMLPRLLHIDDELEAIEYFSMHVIDSILGTAGVVKPQSACFERFGSKGYAILEKVIDHARQRGLVVILDAKRGDIGSSAQHYAVGAANMGAHFITVSPYMGPSSIDPFLQAGLGVFALARTSNPDSDVIQMKELKSTSSNTPESTRVTHAVSSMIADMGKDWRCGYGLSQLGAVVGATKSSEEVEQLRSLMPDQMFLVPGVGAQGGTVEDVRSMVRPDAQSPGQLGVVVNASRSVIYAQAQGDDSWISAVSKAALEFSQQLKSLSTS
jgi:orotidine-5'-phosphate decarboxylase